MMGVEQGGESHGVGLFVWDLPSPLKKKNLIDG